MHAHNRTNSPSSQHAISPSDDADPALCDAIADILLAVTRYPELTDFGFGVYGERRRRLSPEEREAEFQVNRAKMFEECSLLQFISARAWLQGQQKRKTINKMGTSYGLKHVAEHDFGYVTNGIFIAAAISAGFEIERAGAWQQSPNAFMNVSTRAWRRARDGGRRS
jgi:hypothetical protein